MENAVDALVMAGSVLLFIIALTVGISSFSTLRQNIDEIVSYTETVDFAKDSEGYINYLESSNNSAIRIVGVETVMTSVYRSIKENYTVYIDVKNDLDLCNISNLDYLSASEDMSIGSDGHVIVKNDRLIKFNVNNNKNPSAVFKNLYNKIKDKKFYEYLGEYQNAGETTTENKQTQRIITYVLK